MHSEKKFPRYNWFTYPTLYPIIDVIRSTNILWSEQSINKTEQVQRHEVRIKAASWSFVETCHWVENILLLKAHLPSSESRLLRKLFSAILLVYIKVRELINDSFIDYYLRSFVLFFGSDDFSLSQYY